MSARSLSLPAPVISNEMSLARSCTERSIASPGNPERQVTLSCLRSAQAFCHLASISGKG